MTLDDSREFRLVMDKDREISVVPTPDGATVVLTAEDVASVVVIEMTQAELRDLIDGLTELRSDDAAQS